MWRSPPTPVTPRRSIQGGEGTADSGVDDKGSSIDLAPEVKEPVLGLYGAGDAGIKVEQVNQMEAARKAAGKTAEFQIYPGAPHGFVADYRPSYRKEAAEDAWNRMVGWFKKYGVLS
jgi:carboxymethylenebutenolidase